MHISIYSMLCFVFSLIAMSQVTLGIGRLSKVASMLLAPFLAIVSSFLLPTMYWDPSYEYLVVISQFFNRQHCVKGSFRLYFGVVKSHNCSLTVMSQFITKFLFLISANIRILYSGMLLFPLKKFSLKHSRIVAKMNGFFGNVIMTVVDKHTCCHQAWSLLCGN